MGVSKESLAGINLPRHVGIIMDGNGRWALKNDRERTYGHEQGAIVAEKVIEWSKDFNIKYITLYAFSEENWKRPKEEVDFLFELFIRYFQVNFKKIIDSGVKIRFIGRIQNLPEEVYETCLEIQEMSKEKEDLNVILALNYSGRQEIVDAVNKILKNTKDEITVNDIQKNLYLPDVPYPDLIIRTAGEQRLSNFLLWQSAYSELYFTEVLWPDFSREDYLNALLDYSKRERKFGGVPVHTNINQME
ncbi:MAG TPA: polyprenyl diphosphate synthase [Defluviitoga sp.]|nr:polyprenyl diphosphate synthase [Defluviitoga sp.]HOP23847.1 polyprenyl diphosphate synthase [Defluviitoga sp.]HPZ28406.1 polyprenyl diphosphate synthase [Defluviitoga sp.]HQD62504.1 polyprenyl diphosphate synthase [Defluviitoga sp.]